MTLARRKIDVTLKLGKGEFGEGGFDTVKLTGLRVLAKITKAGGASMGTAQLQIFGLPLSIINKVSTLGMIVTTQRLNEVLVEAGDEGGTMSAVFSGNIIDAFGAFDQAPDIPLMITAKIGAFDAVRPIPPTTFKGSADAATILSGLATKIGKGFENNGVQVQLASPYYAGTAREQILACVKDAGIEWNGLDDDKLAIWPAGGSRGGLIPKVSAATGMIGYPAFDSFGVAVRTIFNPGISFGCKVKVESSIPAANNTWRVYTLDYDLQAEQPHGNWETAFRATRVDAGPVVA